MMGKIWVFCLVISLISAIATGNIGSLSDAAMDGAKASVELCLSIGGMILLWSGVLEVMRQSGLMSALTKLLRPMISFLFPSAKHDNEVAGDIASNISANLLGLGNAATPAGIRAAEGLHRLSGGASLASRELCMLVVINTASLQLIPTTIAAIRSGFGAQNPFDILPAVWVSSIASQLAGILVLKILTRRRAS